MEIDTPPRMPQAEPAEETTSEVATFFSQEDEPLKPAPGEKASKNAEFDMVDRETSGVDKSIDGKLTDHAQEIDGAAKGVGPKAVHRRSSKFKLSMNYTLLAIAFVLLVACVAGGLYWRSLLQNQIRMPLSVGGKIPAVGSVKTIVAPSKNLQEPIQPAKPVSPSATPSRSHEPDIAWIETVINNSLRFNHIHTVSVKVNQDMEAVVTGVVGDETVKAHALAIISSYADLKGMEANIRIKPQGQPVSPAMIESEINLLLQNKGISSVTAEVDQNMVVTLKGTVQGKNERKKALSFTKGMKGIKGIKDIIFVVEPQYEDI
ncbi:MAG TPA: BON domain-containing protein [Syntrophorhabdaceae bacterium]